MMMEIPPSLDADDTVPARQRTKSASDIDEDPFPLRSLLAIGMLVGVLNGISVLPLSSLSEKVLISVVLLVQPRPAVILRARPCFSFAPHPLPSVVPGAGRSMRRRPALAAVAPRAQVEQFDAASTLHRRCIRTGANYACQNESVLHLTSCLPK